MITLPAGNRIDTGDAVYIGSDGKAYSSRNPLSVAEEAADVRYPLRRVFIVRFAGGNVALIDVARAVGIKPGDPIENDRSETAFEIRCQQQETDPRYWRVEVDYRNNP